MKLKGVASQTVPRLGQKAPEFSLPDTEGKQRSLKEFFGQAVALLAFFPFAFSGVCDKEMCVFRDGFDDLTAPTTQVVGISVDSVFTLKAFAQTYDLQFPLLSDFNRRVAKLYGVLQNPWVGFDYGGVAKRSVFLVDKKGSLRYKWVTDAPSNEPPYEEVARAAAKLKG
jgi:peroxiredoxin